MDLAAAPAGRRPRVEVARRDGRAALSVTGLRPARGVEIASAVVVHGPDAPFDADALRGLPAELHRAELRIGACPPSVPPGVELHPDPDGPVLRWFLADGVPVTCRPVVCARPDGRPVVCLEEVRIHGPSSVAAPLAATGLLAQAAKALPGVTPLGPLHAALDLGACVAAALAAADLLAPDHAGVTVVSADPRPGELRLVLRRAVRPELPPLPESFLFFADVDRELAEGRCVSASERCVAALREGRDRQAAMIRIAWAVAASPGEFPDAQRVLGRFLSVHEGLPAALLAEAAVLAHRGQHAAAADRLETLASGPRSRPAERAAALLAAARLSVLAADTGRTADLVAEALHADATLFPALELLATLPDTAGAAGGLGPVEATARLCAQAADPRRALLLHRALGLRLLAAGDPDRARRHLERALALDPDDRRSEDALAVAFVRAGQPLRAAALLRAAGRPGDLDGLLARAAEGPGLGELPPMGDGAADDADGPPEADVPGDGPDVRRHEDHLAALRAAEEIRVRIMSAREEAAAVHEPAAPAAPASGPAPLDARPPAAAPEAAPSRPAPADTPTVSDATPAAPAVSPLDEALALAASPTADGRRRLEAILDDEAARAGLVGALAGRDDVPALLLAAELHVRRGAPFAAEQALRAAVDRQPDLPHAWEHLGRLCRARENWSGHVEALTRLAGRAEDRVRWADLLIEAARVRHEHMGERRQALAAVNGVLKALPERTDALSLRAEILEAEGRPAEAFDVLRRALAVPAFPADLRAGAVERAARLAEAMDDGGAPHLWRELLDLRPEHPAALAALQARYEAAGDAGAELAILDRRLAEAGPDGRHRSELLARRAAITLAQRGDRAAAAEDLERALAAWPGNVEAHEALVDVLRAAGDRARLAVLLDGLASMMIAGAARDAVIAERDALRQGP